MRRLVAGADRAGPARGARPGQRGPPGPAGPGHPARPAGRAAGPGARPRGVLAEITSLAGDLGINIYDIEIAHSAEGPRGVLVLVVGSDQAAGRSSGAVTAQGYRCHRAASCRDRGPPCPARSWSRGRDGAADGDGPHARRQVDLPPGAAARGAGRGHLGRHRPVRRGRRGATPPTRWPPSGRRYGRAPMRPAGHGRARRRPGPAAPGRPRPLDCGNSGTGLRLLAGVVAGLAVRDPADRRRLALVAAHGPDRRAPRAMGARSRAPGPRCLPPVTVTGGPLHGIEWDPPVASAQVKSAILLAGLDAEGETVVREPVATRAHTEEMLARAGADVTVDPVARWPSRSGSAGRRCGPSTSTVPGDPSQAAFWVVGGLRRPGEPGRRCAPSTPARPGWASSTCSAGWGPASTLTAGPDGSADLHRGRRTPAWPRSSRRPRSPRSTRCRCWPWRRRRPPGRRSSSTWASCG